MTRVLDTVIDPSTISNSASPASEGHILPGIVGAIIVCLALFIILVVAFSGVCQRTATPGWFTFVVSAVMYTFWSVGENITSIVKERYGENCFVQSILPGGAFSLRPGGPSAAPSHAVVTPAGGVSTSV